MELGEELNIKEKTVINHDVFLNVEYTEATWSVEQSFKDTYQNHLDAQMQKNVDGAISELAEKLKIEEPEILKDFELRKFIYIYFGIKGSQNTDTETDLISKIVKHLTIYRVQEKDAEEVVLSNIESFSVELPEIWYLTSTPNGMTDWKKEDQISYFKGDSNSFQEKIIGIRILDKGSGYDARFKSIFDPSKEDAPEQAGKFGEGAKMSDANLKMKGYKVTSRSAYHYKNETGTHNIVWEAEPVLEMGRMFIKGEQVEVEQEIETGSFTEIIFPENISNLDLLIWDPRRFAIGKKLLWPDPALRKKIYYPSVNNNNYLGIVSGYQLPHYVQGIRVNASDETTRLIFKYACWDKNALDSRDRNKFSKDYLLQIDELWLGAMDQQMAERIIERTQANDDLNGREINVVNGLISESKPKHDLSNEEVDEWRRTFASAFKKIHSIKKDKKYIVLQNKGFLEPEQKEHLNELMKSGFEIIYSKRLEIDDGFREKYLGENIFNLAEATKTLAKVDDQILTEEQREKKDITLERIERSQRELENLLTELNIPHRKITELKSKIVFGEPFKDEVFGWVYDSDKFKYTLVINADSFSQEGRQREMDRILQVYMMALLASGIGKAPNLVDGQLKVQSILDTCVNSTLSSEDTQYNYFSKFDIDAYLKKMDAREASILDTESKLFQKIIEIDISKTDLIETVKFLNENSDSDLADILDKNIFFIGNKVMRVDRKEDVFTLVEADRGSLPVIGESRGEKVQRFGTYVFAGIPPYNFIKYDQDIIFKQDGKIFRRYSSKNFMYELETTPCLKFGANAAYYKVDDTLDKTALKMFNERFNMFGLQSEGRRALQNTELSEGVLNTSLSTEYGKDNWNEPIRFFLDVMQNHINAGNMKILFLVDTPQLKDVWILAEGVGAFDTIKGIKFSDTGPGYAPENVRDLGKGDKGSPTEAGRYKEGQKMLFTAASRNELDFEVRSFCKKNGERMNWNAKATKVPEKVIKQGETKEIQLTGIDLKFENGIEREGSETTILFPDTNTEFYKNCIRVIDPRKGGKYKGLARFARALRENEDVSRIGPITVLNDPDEMGKVYENGLLIDNFSEGNTFLLGGYDMPTVTSNRERNDIDWIGFANYVKFFLCHTTDPRQISKYLNVLEHADSIVPIGDVFDKYADMRVAISQFGFGYVPSAGQFKKAAKHKLGNTFISEYSKEALPALLTNKRFLRYKNDDKGRYLYSKFMPSAENIITELKTEEIQLDVYTRKKIMLVVDNILAAISKANKQGKLLPNEKRKLILEMYKKPSVRSQKIKFNRLSDEHYGLANKREHEISLNESTIETGHTLPGTVVHEMTHLWNNSTDYKSMFIAELLDLAFYFKSMRI